MINPLYFYINGTFVEVYEYVRRNYLVNCDRLNACKNPITFVIKIPGKSCDSRNNMQFVLRVYSFCPLFFFCHSNNIEFFHWISKYSTTLKENVPTTLFTYLSRSFSRHPSYNMLLAIKYRFELHRITFPRVRRKEKNKIIAPTISFQLLNVFINVKRDLYSSLLDKIMLQVSL